MTEKEWSRITSFFRYIRDSESQFVMMCDDISVVFVDSLKYYEDEYEEYNDQSIWFVQSNEDQSPDYAVFEICGYHAYKEAMSKLSRIKLYKTMELNLQSEINLFSGTSRGKTNKTSASRRRNTRTTV